MQIDPYFSFELCVDRLEEVYNTHGNLFVAFDFDDTVFDFHSKGYCFPKMEILLRDIHAIGFTLILFTGNEGEKLEEIVEYCIDRGYPPTYVNENPIAATRKPYYNILLDDKAGLAEAHDIMTAVISRIMAKKVRKVF